MAVMESVTLASKFRGSLIGALLGDCLGSPYEGEINVSKVVLQKYFDKLDGPYFKAPVKQYTDDTAMTKSVAKSLIDEGKFDPKDLAKRFMTEFFNDQRRGYGPQVQGVFVKLRAQKVEDPFGPAKEQFEGMGSFGNGGAMRVAPIALFHHNNYETLIDVARRSTELTHTHREGYNGAILQAIAVQQSLHLDPLNELNVQEFSENLMKKMADVEEDEEGYGLVESSPYKTQLGQMQALLGGEAHDVEVQSLLGTSVAALYSVPTAIFSFLRAHTAIPDIKTENPFRRTIQYAISLGGDTDTIASMAGAIAGAYYGHEIINKSLQQHCELSDEVIKYADQLYEKQMSTT